MKRFIEPAMIRQYRFVFLLLSVAFIQSGCDNPFSKKEETWIDDFELLYCEILVNHEGVIEKIQKNYHEHFSARPFDYLKYADYKVVERIRQIDALQADIDKLRERLKSRDTLEQGRSTDELAKIGEQKALGNRSCEREEYTVRTKDELGRDNPVLRDWDNMGKSKGFTRWLKTAYLLKQPQRVETNQELIELSFSGMPPKIYSPEQLRVFHSDKETVVIEDIRRLFETRNLDEKQVHLTEMYQNMNYGHYARWVRSFDQYIQKLRTSKNLEYFLQQLNLFEKFVKKQSQKFKNFDQNFSDARKSLNNLQSTIDKYDEISPTETYEKINEISKDVHKNLQFFDAVVDAYKMKHKAKFTIRLDEEKLKQQYEGNNYPWEYNENNFRMLFSFIINVVMPFGVNYNPTEIKEFEEAFKAKELIAKFEMETVSKRQNLFSDKWKSHYFIWDYHERKDSRPATVKRLPTLEPHFRKNLPFFMLNHDLGFNLNKGAPYLIITGNTDTGLAESSLPFEVYQGKENEWQKIKIPTNAVVKASEGRGFISNPSLAIQSRDLFILVNIDLMPQNNAISPSQRTIKLFRYQKDRWQENYELTRTIDISETLKDRYADLSNITAVDMKSDKDGRLILLFLNPSKNKPSAMFYTFTVGDKEPLFKSERKINFDTENQLTLPIIDWLYLNRHENSTEDWWLLTPDSDTEKGYRLSMTANEGENWHEVPDNTL